MSAASLPSATTTPWGSSRDVRRASGLTVCASGPTHRAGPAPHQRGSMVRRRAGLLQAETQVKSGDVRVAPFGGTVRRGALVLATCGPGTAEVAPRLV